MPEPLSNTDALLQGLAGALDEAIQSHTGRRHGFVLVVFDPEDARANYVSNADRAQSIDALKGLLARLGVPLAPSPPGTTPANN